MKRFLLRYTRRILSYLLTDKAYIKLVYHIRMHKKLNLDNPVTFTEKLQYLKLYDRKAQYTAMVDKLSVKDYVSSLIGSEHVIPTIAEWNRAEGIDFSALPEKFVLKVTHDSGGLVICKDKSKLNIDEVRNKLKKALKFNYFKYSREWPYKNVEKKIFAEEYMQDSETEDLVDYKFYCFNGEPKFLYFSRFEHKDNEEITFFTLDWTKAPFQRSDHKLLSITPEKPSAFDEMVRYARILSKNIPFVRIDLYEINGKVYFGECSFFPTGGMFSLYPEKYDKIIGDMVEL